MSRALPVIRLDGTHFLVDLLRMEFRELTNPANRISFFELIDKGDHLVLHYNRDTRNACEGAPPLKGKDRVVTIEIPPFRKLDPFRFALLQGRGDTRLDVLTKAVKLLSTPISHHRKHKI
jgi:hypothetical protein